MKSIYILFCSLLSATVIFAQPANDNCSNAQNIPMPATPACPNGNGAPITISGTTNGATPGTSYPYMNGCSTGGNQSSPALDVWYSFVATGTTLNLAVNSTFGTPNIGLWTGNCTSLTGIDCARGTPAGILNYTNTTLSPGTRYFIQISGNSPTASGDFTFTIDNDLDCNNCLTTASLTANPAPVNGTYQPGQTVQICFTINGFNQTVLNWLHGIEYTFGSGWDLTTLTATPSAECPYDPTPQPGNPGSGTWKWYDLVTSSATGTTYGPGFYFDNSNIAGTDPGQNFGDPTNGTCTWTFCITLQVSSNCLEGESLNISINTLADGESGSWESPACFGDPNFTFSAIKACCIPPALTVTNATICSGSSATITATGTPSGGSYLWSTGETSSSITVSPASTTSYTVVYTLGGCASLPRTGTVTVTPPLSPSVSIIASSTSICAGGSVTFTATPINGGSNPTYQWMINGVNVAGQTASTFTTSSLANGNTVTVVMTNNDPCASPLLATSNSISITTTSVTPSVSIAASTTSICSGGSVTFTATPTNGGSNPTYQWMINGGNVAGQTASTFTTSSLANGNTVTVVMTSNDPCASPATATSNSISITTTSVTPSVSIAASATSICSGGSVTFTATPINGGPNPTYQWIINGVNVTGQTASTFTTSSLANGNTVTVVMTSNDPCANPLIAISNSISITITSVTPSVSIAASATSICSGGSVTFTATPINGGSNPTYQWMINGVNVAGQTASTFTTSTLANGNTVTVVMTSNDPCASPVTAASNSISVTITSTTPSVSISSTTTSICSGGSVTFTATAINGGANPTYQWMINGVNVAGQTASTFTTSSLTNGNTVTVVMTSNDPCASPLTATSNSISITTTSVTPSVSIAASTTSICSGGSVTFTATPINGGSNPTYQWMINGVNVAGQTASTFTSSSLANGNTVTVVMTSSDPCASSANATSNSISITTTPSVIPSVSIASTTTSICIGGSVTFTATPTNGGSSPAYQWMINGVNVAGQTTSTFTSSTLANGDIVTAMMTSNNSCASPAIATSNSISISITSVTPSVSIAASTTSICSGGSVTFTATPTNGGSSPAYQWMINGVNVTGQTASTFTSSTLTNGNIITVVMTSNDPCASPLIAVSNSVGITTTTVIPSVSIAASTTSICTGSVVTFTATPTNGGSAPAFQWMINGVNVTGQTAFTFTSSTLANGNIITVVMTSNDPCVSPATATSNSIGITTTTVAPSVTISASTTSICTGSSVTFTATPANGGSAPTYQWMINGVNVTGQTASTFTTSTLANGNTVTVVMTSNDPCANPATATSNSIGITTTSVAPSVTITSGSTSICNGGSVTFITTVTNGGTAPTYQWMVNGIPVAGQIGSAFISSTLNNGDQVSVVMTSNDPCAIPATAISNSISITTTTVTPSVSITATTTSICSGGSVTFTATPTNGGSNPTYQWMINGVNVAGQTVSTFTTTSLASGTAVSVMMTSNDPCANPVTPVQSQSITITNSAPALMITDPPPACAPASVDLTTALVTSGSQAGLVYTYWLDANATTPLSNPTTVMNSGTYYIKAQDAGGCSIIKPVNVSIEQKINGIRYPDVTATANSSLQLNARNPGVGYLYSWSPTTGLNFSNIKDPIFINNAGMEYLITITSPAGCVTVDTLLVKMIPDVQFQTPNVFVPKAWSPNGDGHNDLLFPFLVNITELKYFRIYNRWGQQVFETNINGKGWDGVYNGKPQVSDVYTWTIEAVGIDGKTIRRSGNAVLLR